MYLFVLNLVCMYARLCECMPYVQVPMEARRDHHISLIQNRGGYEPSNMGALGTLEEGAGTPNH